MGATPLVPAACSDDNHTSCCCCCCCSYNAEGGGGTGTVQQLGGNKLQVTFDPQGTPTLQQHQQQVSCCAGNPCVGMVSTRAVGRPSSVPPARCGSIAAVGSCCMQLVLTWQCFPWRFTPPPCRAADTCAELADSSRAGPAHPTPAQHRHPAQQVPGAPVVSTGTAATNTRIFVRSTGYVGRSHHSSQRDSLTAPGSKRARTL